MGFPILVTKLFIPSSRPELVHRPNLIERLNDGLNRKLILASAPAGFGKTTVISNWLDTLKASESDAQTSMKIAWVSLDQDDNDPIRFLTYLATAINRAYDADSTICQTGLSMLQTSQSPSAITVLSTLINDLAKNPEHVILVLDDYHLIQSEPIHEAMSFLIANTPPQLHLVITTRHDPPFALPRLRVRNQLAEFRASDLRFTTAEATEFLNHNMGLNLSSMQIEELGKRTEGWIAGLQLAAISMRGWTDHQAFIQAFTGGNRLILDFLIEEVLNQQTQRVQDFLLKTSILNRLTGSLCNAVSGQENSQQTLEELERDNLFLVPLDEERKWYRYHHLFADLLKQQLFSRGSEKLAELHAKAAVWYEQNGILPEAVYHAFAGNDVKTAARLIEKGALVALEKTNFRFILDTVDRLPVSVVQNSPWLFIYHTWAMLLTGHVEDTKPKIDFLDHISSNISEYDQTQQHEILGNIAGIKMMYQIWTRDYNNLPENSELVKEYLPDNHWIRGVSAIMIGGYFWKIGNLDGAIDAFSESVVAGEACGNKMVAVSGACNQAESLELAGNLRQALDLLHDTFDTAQQGGRLFPVANYIYTGIGRILYELNQLDQADQHLHEGLKLARQMDDKRSEKIINGLLAKVQIAKGETENAYISVQNAEHAVPNYEVDYDLRGADFPDAWVWLKDNQTKELENWEKENRIAIEEIIYFKTKFTLTIRVRVLLFLYREYQEESYIQEALFLLDSLLELAENNGWRSKIIEILALQAIAYREADDADLAQNKLKRALSLAEPEGFIRTFVDEGPPMASLLYEALQKGGHSSYIQQLLSVFPIVDEDQSLLRVSAIDQSGLIEPLSEREIEVLQLMAKGLTNQIIATRLVLSPHTIKTHSRNIYAKLNVNNRTQAVDRARTLGILTQI